MKTIRRLKEASEDEEKEDEKKKFKPQIHRTDKDFTIQKDGQVFLKNDHKGCSGFIAFYAPWCGYCKDTAPAWNNWADMFEGTSFVFLVVDCTDEAHAGKVAAAMQISSYPTVKFIDPRTQQLLSTDGPDGSKVARTKEGLGAFLKKQRLI